MPANLAVIVNQSALHGIGHDARHGFGWAIGRQAGFATAADRAQRKATLAEHAPIALFAALVQLVARPLCEFAIIAIRVAQASTSAMNATARLMATSSAKA